MSTLGPCYHRVTDYSMCLQQNVQGQKGRKDWTLDQSPALEDIVLWTFGIDGDISSANQIIISVRFALSERLAEADCGIGCTH